MKRYLILFSLSVFIHSCSQPQGQDSEPQGRDSDYVLDNDEGQNDFVEKAEEAHRKSAFLKKDYLEFDLQLRFGGKERLNAHITVATNSTESIIELQSGETIITRKDEVWCSPGLAQEKSVRFDAYTWTYFFLFPYKLDDPGTKWSSSAIDSLAGSSYRTAKLTFEPKTGDAPDDWYITYLDRETNLIRYAAYIVTASRSREEAEEDPHAIEYLDYRTISGIPIAHKWKFWTWREREGLTQILGDANLENFQFLSEEKFDFEIPENYVLVEGNVE